MLADWTTPPMSATEVKPVMTGLTSTVEVARNELLELLDEVLDQYEAGRADLSAIVHDVDSLIVELTLLSDPDWIVNVRNQWTVLANVLVEQGRARAWVPSVPGRDRIVGAIRGLGFLVGVDRAGVGQGF